jgi:hypothetical protein
MGYTIHWHVPDEAVCITFDGRYKGSDLVVSLKALMNHIENVEEPVVLIVDYSKAESFDHDGTLLLKIPMADELKEKIRFAILIAQRDEFDEQAEIMEFQTGWQVKHVSTWRQAIDNYTAFKFQE